MHPSLLLDQRGTHTCAAFVCLPLQAAEFFDEVGGSGSPCSSPGAGQPAAGGFGVGQGMQQCSQRALGKLQRFHQLKDESSIRWVGGCDEVVVRVW
jgi:hypothetical protein